MDYDLNKHSLLRLLRANSAYTCEMIQHYAIDLKSDLRAEAYVEFQGQVQNSCLGDDDSIDKINELFDQLTLLLPRDDATFSLLISLYKNWWLEWTFVHLMQTKTDANLSVEVQNITHLTHGQTLPLRQHELSHYANLFTQVPTPLCNVSTVNGNVIRLNQRFVDVFGYTIDDIPTLEVWWQKAYPDPAYRQWVLSTWQQAVDFAITYNTDIEPKHYEVMCKNGHVITMEISGIHIENEFLAIFKDATQRIATEDFLRDMAFLDSLTKIANRRRFDEKLTQELQSLEINQLPLSIILIDIDYFKQFNDQYGHLAGDECLYKVAQAICGAVSRPNDFVARYGGEEFVVLLPNTKHAGAYCVAQNIQQAIISLELPHAHSRTGSVTLSLGINTTKKVIDTHCFKQFIETADRALYKAKQQGRNSIAYID